VVKSSFKQIFNKSEREGNGRSGKILPILLFVLLVIIGAYLAYPLVFDKSRAAQNNSKNSIVQQNVQENNEVADAEMKVREKTQFDIEVEQREMGYEKKIFSYEPYISPSNRDPFEKVKDFYASVEDEEVVEGENELKSGSQLINNISMFIKPELPEDSRVTGIFSSNGNKVAIIQIEGEIYISKLYDILSDKYIVKEIKNNEVILDYKGSFFSLKVGGENSSDEL